LKEVGEKESKRNRMRKEGRRRKGTLVDEECSVFSCWVTQVAMVAVADIIFFF